MSAQHSPLHNCTEINHLWLPGRSHCLPLSILLGVCVVKQTTGTQWAEQHFSSDPAAFPPQLLQIMFQLTILKFFLFYL